MFSPTSILLQRSLHSLEKQFVQQAIFFRQFLRWIEHTRDHFGNSLDIAVWISFRLWKISYFLRSLFPLITLLTLALSLRAFDLVFPVCFQRKIRLWSTTNWCLWYRKFPCNFSLTHVCSRIFFLGKYHFFNCF